MVLSYKRSEQALWVCFGPSIKEKAELHLSYCEDYLLTKVA